MNTYATLNLGNFIGNTVAVRLGTLTYPVNGTYAVESIINGQFKSVNITGVAGNPVDVVNAVNYPEDATVMVRVKLPTGSQIASNTYLNDYNGHIWFQWSNIPVQ